MTKNLRNTVSLLLCLVMLCGVLPIDSTTMVVRSGMAEAPVATENEPTIEPTEKPTAPPTEEPIITASPAEEPEVTVTPAEEPSFTPEPINTPEVTSTTEPVLPSGESSPLPDHPYLVFAMLADGLSVTALHKQVKTVLIPALVDGIPVVSIDKGAFENADEVETVTIEEGLLSIGKEAFKDCVALTEVSLPTSITDIASNAFDGCVVLKTIITPDQLCYAYVYADAWLKSHCFEEVSSLPTQSAQPQEPEQTAIPENTAGSDGLASDAVGNQKDQDVDEAAPSDIIANAPTDTDPLAGLIINGNPVIGVGKSAVFTATVQSTVYTNADAILWALASTAAASLKISGNTVTVTAKVASSNPIALTATLQKDRKISATVYLSILPLASKVTVTSETGRNVLDINVPEDSIQLAAQVIPEAASQTVVWKSSNPTVASVDTNGRVTVGIKTGMAVITASVVDGSKKTGTYQITVNKALTNIALTGAVSVGIGKTAKPNLVFTPADATNKNVIWTSSDPIVATVSTTGLVKGIVSGEVTIVATSKENPALKAEWLLTVAPAVTKITVTGAGVIDLSADMPHEKQLTVTTIPASATAGVVWSSSKPSVATVDANGLVTATGVTGSAIIKASATDGSNQNATAVISVGYLPTGIQIVGSTTLVAGKSTTLRANITPSAALQTVIWTSSNKAVATVDTKGIVKANAYAATNTRFTITATSIADKSFTTSLDMSIAAPVGNFSIKGARTMDMLTDTVLVLSAETDIAEPLAVFWTSANPKIATIDAFGTVKPLMAGTVTIIATAADGSGKKATVDIPVISCVERINSANNPSLNLALGKSLKLSTSVDPSTALASDRVLSWVSSDPQTVSVTNGLIKALKITSKDSPVIITAMAAGLSKSGEAVLFDIAVTVTPVATGVMITKEPNQTYINLNSDQKTIQLTAAVLPGTGCQLVQWQSSNPAVASVEPSGLVTGLTSGKVTITATTLDGSQKKATLSMSIYKGAQSITIVGVDSIRGGLSATYTATVKPSTAGQAVLWSMEADTVPAMVNGALIQQPVATISTNGIVKTIAVSERKQATITAVSKDDRSILSSMVIWILPASTRVSIEADRNVVSTNPVSALQLNAIVEPADAQQNVTWHTSNTAIASVSEDGLVTGKSIGNVIITATAKDGSNASAHKWISVGESLQKLEIVGPSDLGVGAEANLTVKTTPSIVAISDVIWTSNDENVAMVDAHGHIVVADSIDNPDTTVVITAVSLENPTISDTLAITVRPAVTNITLTPNTKQYIDFTTGTGYLQLDASVEPTTAFSTLLWTSSDEAVVTVDDAGLVEAHQTGTAMITATALDLSGVSASVEISVIIPATEIRINGPTILGGGCSAQMAAEILPANTTETDLVWSLQNVNSPATIDATGLFSADAVSELIEINVVATIYGIADVAGEFTIMIYPAAQSLSTTYEPIYIDLNSSETEVEINPSILPSNAYQAVDWSTSDSSIATVDVNGLVTARGVGVATITATTKDGTQLTCQNSVRVEKPDFSYTNYNGDLLLTEYLKQPIPENIIMPDQILGRLVVAMDEGLFMNATSLKTIHISRAITAIPADTFNGCINLTEVWLSDHVTGFGDRCFNGCIKLQAMQTYADVTIP